MLDDGMRQTATHPASVAGPPDSTPCDELVRLARTVLPKVEESVRVAYPQEGCGYVTKSGVVVPCRNSLADDLDDPSGRTARCAFAFSADDAIRLAESFDSADPAAILYHAHMDAGAALSLEDRFGMTIRRRSHEVPDLAWPGLACLVIALSCRATLEAELYMPANSSMGPCISWSCSLGPGKEGLP